MSTHEKLWQPGPERARSSQMYDFLRRAAAQYGLPEDWESLRRWSIEHRDKFWPLMLAYADIRPSMPAIAAVTGEGMLGTRWFPGMRLNYARHMLRFEDDADAILFESEVGRRERLTHAQLRDAVARVAAALRADGVQRGDRVVGYMPNVPATVIAMLAAASLGAVWSSCSPDFGVQAVLDRFGQIEPAVLFAPDGYTYGGKRLPILDRVREVAAQLPALRRIVVVPYLNDVVTHGELDAVRAAARGAAVSLFGDYLGSDLEPAPPLTFEEVPFDHPLFIMYSSGTTGVPKCIVHGHGGTLLQHMKELMLHCDLRPGERIFYFTTCGWMMWNWLVSGLGVGAAVVLYDGNPSHPTVHRLWELAETLKINVFGTSPKFLAACQKARIRPGHEHDLSSLRAVLSTGSPLTDEQFRWVYAEIKRDLMLASICGGTDIISCFILGNPMLPVYCGEIQCRGLGMDVHAWDDGGKPVMNQKGELVCTAPFPSQPVGFWNDPDGRKYRAAYFEHEWRGRAGGPPVWRHGDFIEIRDTGGVVVYGRSDATLNPGGIRIGTAEIYRIVETLPEVVDSLVCGRNTSDGDVEICLFVVLREGVALTSELRERIRAAIAAGASKRHVPRHIQQVTAIPYTISGKKVELAVQAMLHGETVKNRDALANPEALEQYRTIPPAEAK